MLGFFGSTIIDDTNNHNGAWTVIEAVTDTTFATLTSDVTYNSSTVLATGANIGTLTAGSRLYGTFTLVDLATGKVILYK